MPVGVETNGLLAGVVYKLSSVVPGAVGVVFGAEAGRVGVPVECSGAYGEEGLLDACSGEEAEPVDFSHVYGEEGLPEGISCETDMEADAVGCSGAYGEEALLEGSSCETDMEVEAVGCSGAYGEEAWPWDCSDAGGIA